MKIKLNLCFNFPASVSPAGNNLSPLSNHHHDHSTPDNLTTTTSSSPPSAITSSSLHSNLSLQSLPSIPSLELQNIATSLILPSSPATSFSSSSSRLPHPISSLALSAPFLYAAAGSQVHVFNSSTLTHLHSFPPSSTSAHIVKSISLTNFNRRRFVITAHQDGKIRVWLHPDIDKPTQPHRFVTVLPTSVDRLRRFVLPKNYVRIRRHKKRLWIYHNDAVSALAVSNGYGGGNGGESDLVYSVSWDKCLKIWRGSDFKCMESVTVHEDAVNAVTVSPDGIVYTGSADGRIRVWAKGDGENSKHILVATLEKHKSAVNALALMVTSSSGDSEQSLSSTVLFSGACDRSILVWEREGTTNYMAVVGALRGHWRAVLCLITVDDVLFSGSADGTVRMWRRDLLGLERKFCCLVVLDGHLSPVKSLAAVVMGGEYEEGVVGSYCQNAVFQVFSGSLDGEIRLWRVKVLSL